MTHDAVMTRLLRALPTALLLAPAAAALPQESPEATGFEEEVDEWEALDRELAGSTALAMEQGRSNLELWGYLRLSAGYVGAETLTEEDFQGVVIDAARMNLTGQVGSFDYRLTGEFFDGRGRVLDAWLRTGIGEEMAFTIGRFRAPFLRSGLVEARDLLFILRTRNGFFWQRRDSADDGVMLHGDHGRFHWAASTQNGYDPNPSNSQRVTGSVRINLIGARELPWEGAYGAGDQTRLAWGAGVSNDDAAEPGKSGLAWNTSLYLVHHRFSLAAEIVDYGDGYSDDPVLAGQQLGDTRPWTITSSYMLVPETYEVALRYDDYDDVQQPVNYDRSKWTLGLNRYIRGHDLKWQFNYAYFDNGGSSTDRSGGSLAVGITASF